MARSYASAVIEAPVEAVWQVVRDFDGLARFHPGVAASEIEGGGPADAVGAVRHLTLGDGASMRERLVALDDTDRSYTYDILDGRFPVRHYRATIRVAPITADDRTFVEWHSHYDVEAAAEAELDATFTVGVYGPGLKGLQEHLAG